nr:MAG: hypothetical protein [Bacteriophage sp.]
METINFKAVERSSQDVSVTINRGNSERWSIQSQKTKYVNGKMSGVIGVSYSVSINNTSDYLLEEDKGNNQIEITAPYGGTSGTCVLTQNESGNKINLHLTTPEEKKEYWEIHFNPISVNGIDTDAFFVVNTNISGESGAMANGTQYKNWIVNQNRNTINIYVSPAFVSSWFTGPESFDMLSWSCLDKDGNAFSPNYSLPDNSYFITKTTGLGSYTLRKISTPSNTSNGSLIFSSSFNPTKKYPLDLNFYWGIQPEYEY